MKKAVVFDLDGTLINSLPDIAKAMNRALRLHGYPEHPQEAYRRFVGDGVFNLALRALGGHSEHADEVRAAYSDYYAEHSLVHSAPYDNIGEMLRSLNRAGIRICVLSNKDDADTRVVVGHYFPDISFAAVRGRRDGYPVKPDPAALVEILGELELSAGDVWYVGDTRTDMRCGRNGGMQRIAVLWGFQSKAELLLESPEHFAGSVIKLKALLLG